MSVKPWSYFAGGLIFQVVLSAGFTVHNKFSLLQNNDSVKPV